MSLPNYDPEYPPSPTTPPPTSPTAPPPDPFAQWGGYNSTGHRKAIADAYTTSLHRPIKDNEYDYWLGNTDFANQIANSAEAKNYRAPTTPPPAGAPGLSRPAISGPQFADPSQALLEQLAKDRIDRLGVTPPTPGLDAFVQSLLDKEKLNQGRAQTFADQMSSRVKELQAPVYSSQEEQAIQSKAYDQLERRRTQTLKNSNESIYARGFAPTSGIIEGNKRAIDTNFEQARTGIASDLVQSGIAETQNRRNQATQLQGLIQQALEGGDTTSLQYQGQIADIEAQKQTELNTRERERLATAAIPVDLTNNALQQGLQVLGQGGNPTSLINSILGLLGASNQSAQTRAYRNANNLSGVGTLVSLLGSIFSPRSGA